jgi:hypothetical protein
VGGDAGCCGGELYEGYIVSECSAFLHDNLFLSLDGGSMRREKVMSSNPPWPRECKGW